MVLAGAGVDHAELVRLAEPLLAAAPRGGAATGEPESSYVGGDWRWVGVAGEEGGGGGWGILGLPPLPACLPLLQQSVSMLPATSSIVHPPSPPRLFQTISPSPLTPSPVLLPPPHLCRPAGSLRAPP